MAGGCPDVGRERGKPGLARWRVCSSLSDRGGCFFYFFFFFFFLATSGGVMTLSGKRWNRLEWGPPAAIVRPPPTPPIRPLIHPAGTTTATVAGPGITKKPSTSTLHKQHHQPTHSSLPRGPDESSRKFYTTRKLRKGFRVRFTKAAKNYYCPSSCLVYRNTLSRQTHEFSSICWE